MVLLFGTAEPRQMGLPHGDFLQQMHTEIGCFIALGSTRSNMKPLSQLSTQAGSSDSAPFPDHVPIEPWDAPLVTAAESSSPTTQSLHGPELVDCLTLLALQIKQNNELMAQLIQTQRELALAIREDGQDDDPELPRTYMDGTPI